MLNNKNNNTNNNKKSISLNVKTELENTWGGNPEWAELTLSFRVDGEAVKLQKVVDNNHTRKNWRPTILVDAVLASMMWMEGHGFKGVKIPQTKFLAEDFFVPARHGKHPAWKVWLGENLVKCYRKTQCVDSALWLTNVSHLPAILRSRAQELMEEKTNPFKGKFFVKAARS